MLYSSKSSTRANKQTQSTTGQLQQRARLRNTLNPTRHALTKVGFEDPKVLRVDLVVEVQVAQKPGFRANVFAEEVL